MAPPSLLDVSRLGQWATQWDQLVDASPLPSPFLRSWWLTGAGRPGRHFLLVVDGARLLGGLAVEKRHPMPSIRMMADGSLCPDHLDLLSAPGHETAVVSLLREWLCRPGEFLLDLQGIQVGSRLIEALPGRVRLEPMAVAPFTPLPDSPEAYRASLPSQFRKNLRVSAKRLAAEGVKHRTIRGQAVPQHLDILRELHQSQWGNRSGFLPVFDRFAAGFAGGCAADEVVVHELGNDDLVVATVTAFEVSRPGEPVPERPAHRSPLEGCHDRPARRHHRRRMCPGPQRSGLPPRRRALQETIRAEPAADVEASSGPGGRGPTRRLHLGGDVPGHADSGPVRSVREDHRRPVEGLTA